MSEETKQKTFKQTAIDYLKVNFSKKNNIWRAIWFAVAVVVVLVIAIPLNIWAYKNKGYTSGHNGFITINVVFNLGNGFGSGAEWPQGVVYFLKIFMSIIILALVIFLPCKWYLIFPLSASFVGGMFNVFDKVAHDNYVIDYFALFPPNAWFIFNAPDFFITGGIIFACGAYLVVLIIQAIKNRKHKPSKE